MALPNTEKLTSQLATMPDAALRQMAMMHKNDPYILPLVIAEDGRRKQMRQASQAQQYQPQPKVAEAEAAQVGQQLPEHVGIGALPAPNMAQMAGGGITGDGYDRMVGDPSSAPGYADGGGVLGDIPGMTESALYQQAVEKYQRNEPLTPTEKALIFASAPFAAAADVATLPINIARKYITPDQNTNDVSLTPAMDTRRRAMANILPEQVTAAANPPTQAGARYTSVTPESQQEYRPRRTPEPLPLKTEAGDTGKTEKTPPSGAARSGTPAATSLETIMKQARGMANNTSDPRLAEIQRQVGELGKAGEDVASENLRLTQERQAKFSDAFKGREERLNKRESELEADKTQNAGLALLQAGFAIMSTPGSLGTAVGKGAQAGLASFGAGLEKLKASQDKLAEARDRLDEAKLNREETSAKEMQEAQLGVKRAAAETKKIGIDMAIKQYGWSREDAKTFFEGGVKLEAERIQQAGGDRRANAPLALVETLSKNPQLLATYQAMHGDKADPMGHFTKWLEKNPQMLGKPQNEQVAAFLAAQGVLSTAAKLGSGTVGSKPTGQLLQ